jgi:predicted NBD/HSP70 family sugar kinase
LIQTFADAEIGHILLEHQGGSLQRWEEFGSGSAIVRHFGKKASEITDEKDWYAWLREILPLALIDLVATLNTRCQSSLAVA